MLLEKGRRPAEDRVVQAIAQVGDHAEAGMVHQVGPRIVADSLQYRGGDQRKGHDGSNIVEIRRHELLQIDGVPGVGKKLNGTGTGRRIQKAVENRTDQQDAEGIEQSHRAHQHDRCQELPPVGDDVAQEAG